jgi:hypothetical protein
MVERFLVSSRKRIMQQRWIGLSKLEWQFFAINLIPGLTWGLCGVLFAQRILGINNSGRFGEWEFARPVIVIGMCLGVPTSAIRWYRRGCPTQIGLLNQFVAGFNNVLFGIIWGVLASFVFVLIGSLGIWLMSPQNAPLDFSALFLGIPLVFFGAMIWGIVASIWTVIPISLIMQPLTNLVWEKWFTTNEKEIKELAPKI